MGVLAPFTSEAQTIVLDTPSATVEPATLLDVTRPATRVFRDRDGLPEHAIMSIVRDARGPLVVATRDGVATYDGHEWTTLDMPSREISNFVRTVHVDEAGALWRGRQDGGVARYDANGWTSFDLASGLPSGRVNFVTSATAGDGTSRRAIWVATEHGIARHDGERWTTFGDADERAGPTPGNDTPVGLARFRAEGARACRLDHPNVVNVLDSGTSVTGIAHMVMELLEGRSLSDEL
jgi:hypothetical protein